MKIALYISSALVVATAPALASDTNLAATDLAFYFFLAGLGGLGLLGRKKRKQSAA